MVGGLREFEVPSSGRLVQGGADAVRCFYKEPGAIIVNCARRTGSASVEVRGGCGNLLAANDRGQYARGMQRLLERLRADLVGSWDCRRGRIV